MSTLDQPTVLTPASPRELKELIRDWRKGRATRNLMEAFNDAYVVVIGALMVGAMVVNVVLRAQRTVAACDTASCLSARTLLPWAAFAAAVAVALAASRLFGPVLASAAEGFWLLDAPISRAKLLGPRLVGAVVAGRRGRRGDRCSDLRPDRLRPRSRWPSGPLPPACRGGGGGVRRRPAGGGAAPADPCRRRTSSACSPWRP